MSHWKRGKKNVCLGDNIGRGTGKISINTGTCQYLVVCRKANKDHHEKKRARKIDKNN